MDQIPLSPPSSMHAHINDALHIPASGCSIIILILVVAMRQYMQQGSANNATWLGLGSKNAC